MLFQRFRIYFRLNYPTKSVSGIKRNKFLLLYANDPLYNAGNATISEFHFTMLKHTKNAGNSLYNAGNTTISNFHFCINCPLKFSCSHTALFTETSQHDIWKGDNLSNIFHNIKSQNMIYGRTNPWHDMWNVNSP